MNLWSRDRRTAESERQAFRSTVSVLVPMLVALALSICGSDSAQATDAYTAKGAGHYDRKWQSVPADRKGAVAISVTTENRDISGWEQEVIGRYPNLNHWTWIPMLEPGRNYIHVAPGDPGHKRNIYKKVPKRVRNPHESHYIRPVHLPMPTRGSIARRSNPLPPRMERDANGNLIANDLNGNLSLPQVGGRLAANKTSIAWKPYRYDKPVHVPLPVRTDVAAALRSRNVDATLSARQVSAQLRSKQTQAQVIQPDMADEDAFSATGVTGTLYASKLGGRLYGSGSSAQTSVQGQVLPTRRR